MKQIIPTYTFNAAGKAITLTDFGTVRLDRILLIVNVTRNVIYYNFADASLGATVATNVITLTNVSTSGHANGDKLEIFYDTVSGDPDYLTAQPVSATSLPLPADASTATAQSSILAAVDGVETLLAGGLPASLAAGGGVKVEGVSGGVSVNVAGAVASGAADSGNPVKVGAKHNTTLPTLTDGQRGDLQLTARGQLAVGIFNPGSLAVATVQAAADAIFGSVSGICSNAVGYVYNGSTWDRERGNIAAVVLASGARTTTQTGADQTNYNHKGIVLTVDVTSAGTGSITASIQGKDANGIYYTILSGAAITTNSTNVYRIYPSMVVAANVSADATLPRTFRVVITANNANSITYSSAYDLVL